MTTERRVRPRPIDVEQPVPIFFLTNDEAADEVFDEPPAPPSRRDRIWQNAAAAAAKARRKRTVDDSVLVPGCALVREPPGVAARVQPWKRPASYVEFGGRSLDDLVEFELDDDAEDFLGALNRALTLDGAPARSRLVSADELEAVLTYFEHESFFQRAKGGVLARYAPYSDLYSESNGDAETPCALCNDPDCTDVNQIVFCDGCDIAVHQLCYGVESIPAGSWLCRRCSRRDASRTDAQCRLCPVRGGAMWACAGGIGWAHVLCALFVPGVTFGVSSASDDRNQTLSGGVHINDDIDSDVDDKVLVGASKMATKRPHAAVSPSFRSSLPLLGTNAEEDVIHGLTNLPVSYLGQECSLCHTSIGIASRCSQPGCEERAHVMCARQRGLLVDVVMTPQDRPHRIMYCRAHSIALQLAAPSTTNMLSPVDLEQLAMGLMNSTNILQFPAPALQLIYQYWRQRRRLHPQPLIARLRRGRENAVRCSLAPEEYQARFLLLRQAFEKARILVDLVQKRELVKQQHTAHYTRVQELLEERAARAAEGVPTTRQRR